MFARRIAASPDPRCINLLASQSPESSRGLLAETVSGWAGSIVMAAETALHAFGMGGWQEPDPHSALPSLLMHDDSPPPPYTPEPTDPTLLGRPY